MEKTVVSAFVTAALQIGLEGVVARIIGNGSIVAALAGTDELVLPLRTV